MQVFGLNVVYFVGAAMIAVGAVFLSTILLGALAVVIFLRTRRVFIPTVTLLILNAFKTPIKQLLWIFGIEGDFIDSTVVSMRNMLYRKSYLKTPYDVRAIFLPQCLRHPDCPAKLTGEGIACINCGRCGIGELKALCDDLGYLFFVVPGSSFVKRMIKKYRPKAVLGVGCLMEVDEGTALMSSIGVPVQSVTLLRDGCINTRVDVMKLVEKIVLREGQEVSMRYKWMANRIAGKWSADASVPDEEKNRFKERYHDIEENLLKVKRRLW